MTESTRKSLPIGALVGIGLAALVIIIGVSSWLNAANTGAEQEAGLRATMDNNRQILATYGNTIGEMAQIPAMQRDNLNSVLETALSARYGEDGSQAVFQFITENYPGTLDNTLYQNIQSQIVAGRAQFQQNQTVLLDKKRVYEIILNRPISGFWMKLAGYPKTDLSKIIAVSSARADAAFETGQDNGLTINNPAAPTRQRDPNSERPAPRELTPAEAEAARAVVPMAVGRQTAPRPAQ